MVNKYFCPPDSLSCLNQVRNESMNEREEIGEKTEASIFVFRNSLVRPLGTAVIAAALAFSGTACGGGGGGDEPGDVDSGIVTEDGSMPEADGSTPIGDDGGIQTTDGGAADAGEPGTNILSRTTDVPAGADCALGGARVETGTDTNGNGVLDDGEVENASLFCNADNSKLLPDLDFSPDDGDGEEGANRSRLMRGPGDGEDSPLEAYGSAMAHEVIVPEGSSRNLYVWLKPGSDGEEIQASVPISIEPAGIFRVSDCDQMSSSGDGPAIDSFDLTSKKSFCLHIQAIDDNVADGEMTEGVLTLGPVVSSDSRLNGRTWTYPLVSLDDDVETFYVRPVNPSRFADGKNVLSKMDNSESLVFAVYLSKSSSESVYISVAPAAGHEDAEDKCYKKHFISMNAPGAPGDRLEFRPSVNNARGYVYFYGKFDGVQCNGMKFNFTASNENYGSRELKIHHCGLNYSPRPADKPYDYHFGGASCELVSDSYPTRSDWKCSNQEGNTAVENGEYHKYYNAGDGICLKGNNQSASDVVQCIAGYRPDKKASSSYNRYWACVPEGECYGDRRDNGKGTCVGPKESCASGYHDGGDGVWKNGIDAALDDFTFSYDWTQYQQGGTCVPNGTCAPGFHDDGRNMGYCLPENRCANLYWLDKTSGDGARCVNGSANDNYGCAEGYYRPIPKDRNECDSLEYCSCMPLGTCPKGTHFAGIPGGHDVSDGHKLCYPGNAALSDADCGPGWRFAGDGKCLKTSESCETGWHDDGEGHCVQEGCAAGHHDGGGTWFIDNGIQSSYTPGACVPAGTCSDGYHDKGNGECGEGDITVPNCHAFHAAPDYRCYCADGYHHDGAGKCIPGNLAGYDGCAKGYHNNGRGECVSEDECATGFVLRPKEQTYSDGTKVIREHSLCAKEPENNKFVKIPGGLFTFDTLYRLPGFKIHQRPASVADYKECVLAGACRGKEGVDVASYNPDASIDSYAMHVSRRFCTYNSNDGDDRPINCISYYEARRYCDWQKAKLPNGIQYLYAAMNDGYLARLNDYPWGNSEPEHCHNANYLGYTDSHQSLYCHRTDRVPLPSAQGPSRIGLYSGEFQYSNSITYPSGDSLLGLVDMYGNTGDWTELWESDWVEANLSSAHASGFDTSITFGTTWLTPLTTPMKQLSFGRTRTDLFTDVGVRCVMPW